MNNYLCKCFRDPECPYDCYAVNVSPKVSQKLLQQVNAADVLAKKAREIIDEQAEDEALWAVYIGPTQPISEAYLQQELRRLHAVVEEHLEAYEKVRGMK